MMNQGLIANSMQDVDPQVENRLWDAYRRGPDKDEAYRQLVEFYLPLVVHTVERLSIRVRQQIEKEELLSVGVVGLHHAIRGYSKDRGVSFANYARKRIKGSVLDELRRQDHLSRSQRKEYRELCAKIRIYTEEHGRPPGDDELSELVGMGIEQIRYLIEMAGTAVSLSETSTHGTPYIDIIADNRSESPSQAADRKFSREALRAAFRKLDERDQQLMYLRHHEGMRVKEIAEIMGVTEGRISQIYKEILLKLRVLLEAKTPN